MAAADERCHAFVSEAKIDDEAASVVVTVDKGAQGEAVVSTPNGESLPTLADGKHTATTKAKVEKLLAKA